MATKSPKTIKVLFITRAYGQRAGGMERLSYELIHTISGMRDVTTRVIANHTSENASLLQARLRSIGFLLFIAPKAVLQARKYDVVHIGDPVLSKIGWLIQRIWKKPVVVTVHGLDVQYGNPVYRFYLRMFFRNFDVYVAISSHAKKALKPWNVRGLVRVIPPGMSDTIYAQTYTREDLSALLHADVSKRKVLLTVGRLVPRKGHAWFVRSVLPKLPQSYLYVIAGSGSEAEAITDAAIESGVTSQVIQLGRVSDKELRVLYNTVDAFVQPNIHIEGDAEGFGIVLLEAALCNRTVIASNVDGIPDAIHDNKNGHLIPSEDADAWVKALKSISRKESLQAREYTLRTFAWDKIASRYLTVFRQLLQTQEKE